MGKDNKTFNDDELGRHEFAKNVAQVIEKFIDKEKEGGESGYVISIDSNWGGGKTWFTKMLMNAMEKGRIEKNTEKIYECEKEYKCIYFNASANDYKTTHPLMEVSKSISGRLSFLKFFILITSLFFSLFLIKSAFPKLTTLKTIILTTSVSATGWIIALKTSIPLTGWIASKFPDIIFKRIENKFNKIAKEEEKVAKKIRKKLSQATEGNKKLIIFIDELDRCRPSYVMDLLEDMKHIFSVKGVMFVLSINRDELCKIINSHYGVNAEHYLKKFIDYNIPLPEPSFKEYAKLLFDGLDDNFLDINYLEGRYEKFSLRKEAAETFALASNLFELSLRDMEQCFSEIKFIYISFLAENIQKTMLSIFILIIVIKNQTKWSQTYNKIKNKDICQDSYRDQNLLKSLMENEIKKQNELIDSFYHNSNIMSTKSDYIRFIDFYEDYDVFFDNIDRLKLIKDGESLPYEKHDYKNQNLWNSLDKHWQNLNPNIKLNSEKEIINKANISTIKEGDFIHQIEKNIRKSGYRTIAEYIIAKVELIPSSS